MLNIFIVDNYNLQQDNGLNTYVTQLTNGLKEKSDIQLHFVWINYPGISAIEFVTNHHSIEIKIPKFSGSSNSINIYEHSIASAIASRARGLKNCIVHFNWINHCSIASYIKAKLECTIVLTKHCIPWRDLITHDYHTFLKLDWAFKNKKVDFVLPEPLRKEKLNYEAIDHIITVTDYAKQSLVGLLNVDKSKISVIYNGIDIKKFDLDNLRSKYLLRKKYGFGKNEKVVLYVGSINKRKGIIDLVKSFESLSKTSDLKNLKLIIVGAGDFSSVIEAIKGAWSKITFMGSMRKDELYEIYKIADVGVIPSYVEQCSYCAIEMMLSSLAIISSDVDGLKEIIPEGATVRIPMKLPKDGQPQVCEESLTKALSLILKDKLMARQIRKKAKLVANFLFYRDLMVEKTINVYHLAQSMTKHYKKIDDRPAKLVNFGPLVSIIMPAFNASSFIQEAISDVLNQSYSNFELIIIDDGSTDNTSLLTANFNDPRLIFKNNAVKKGIVQCLNSAIKLSKGKYIARMDADDRMDMKRLERQIAFLETNPEYGMVGSWYNIIDKFGKIQNRIEGVLEDSQIKLGMLFSNQFAHPSVMLRAEVLKANFYDSEYLHCEDYELWTRIQLTSKVANLPDYLISYRIHESNTSILNNHVMRQNVSRLLSRELDRLGIDHSIEELALHSAISFGLGNFYFKSQENKLKLYKWLDKICDSSKLKAEFGNDSLTNLRKHVLENYCNVYD